MFTLPLETAPMEARSAEALPEDDGPWQFEPKWDGFRCVAFKAGRAVELRAKSGKPLGRYFPEIVTALQHLPAERFVVDGELVIRLDGKPSFEALQMRLHPAASRIGKLAATTPAELILFDVLVTPDGHDVTAQPLRRRRRLLEAFVAAAGAGQVVRLSPRTIDAGEARQWLRESGEATDGIVCKRLDDAYRPGERAMVKVKRRRTADCVVGGFRYQSASREVGSLLLGLYDRAGLLDHVGFTATIGDLERPRITRELEALRAPPGFTGRAPGGPSRWSTERSSAWEPLAPELVVEVRFGHVTGGRFRHGTKLVRWRPDKAPRQCTFAQLEPPA
nr:ATP-dependent DNA ligase [Chelatococcus reniformis]